MKKRDFFDDYRDFVMSIKKDIDKRADELKEMAGEEAEEVEAKEAEAEEADAEDEEPEEEPDTSKEEED